MVKSIYVPDVETDDLGDSLWKDVSPNEVMATNIVCKSIQSDSSTSLTSSMSRVQTDSRLRNGGFKRPVLVAGIDIGNTCTKFAFQSQHDFEQNPTRIITDIKLCTKFSTAIPTVVLLDDNKQFDSFGYDAIDRYEDHREWHFFGEIKQPLYQMTEAGSVFYINDQSGKETPAVDVIRAIIHRIKDYFHTMLKRSYCGVLENEIYWVITVPAVFTVQAVSVVKQAAIMAGIEESYMNIALESVAALEYCHMMHKYEPQNCTYHRSHGLASSTTDIFSDVKQYMVVDIGGETLDVTVLENDATGNVTQLHKVCGVGYGGSSVKKSVDHVLTTIVGPEAYNSFRTGEYGYRKMHEDIYNKLKAAEGSESKMNIVCRIPELVLTDLKDGGHFADALKTSSYDGKISVYREKLIFTQDFWKSLLAKYCLSIVQFLKAVRLEKARDKIKFILLVGGYAGFKTIQEALIYEFLDADIFVPLIPEMAIVGGATLLGYKPPSNIERAKVTGDTVKRIENAEINLIDHIQEDIACGSDFVQSFNEILLSSEEETVNASSKIQAGLASLKQRMKGSPQQIAVKRNDIIDDVIASHRDIDILRPLKVHFVGGDDSDVTKEMFGFFWETISSVWFRGENVVIPVVPVARRAEARRIFPVLGKILENTLCTLGQFPPQLCRSIILAIAHPDEEVDADIVLEDYLLFLPERENELLTESLNQKEWSEQRKKRMERFFNLKKISLHPTPISLKGDLIDIAYAEIIDSSHVYTGLMRRGISDFAKDHFFDLLDSDTLSIGRWRLQVKQ